MAAVFLWVSTFGLIFAGTMLGLFGATHRMPAVLALMAHGLACSAAAATMTIRHMLRKQNVLLQEAFELGRDLSGGSSVRRVRP